jgi:hypothetical protein
MSEKSRVMPDAAESLLLNDFDFPRYWYSYRPENAAEVKCVSVATKITPQQGE